MPISRVRPSRYARLSMPSESIISQRYLAKAPCPTNQRVRLPVSLAHITAACCMSIRSVQPTVRYRPIWIYCASPRKPLSTASTRVWRANHESLCDYRKSGYGDVSQRSYRIAGRHFSGSGRLNCRAGRRKRFGKINAFKALMGFVRGAGEISILQQPVNKALKQNLIAYVPSQKRWTGRFRYWWKMW